MSFDLTVFIPAYNEQANLMQCVQVVQEKLSLLGVNHEILIVDDGSQDATGELAQALARRHTGVRLVRHAQNRGIGGAFVTAIQHAQGEWMILIPADLALHPDELRHYIDAAPNADVVVGLRSDRSDYTLLRKLISTTNICLIRWLFGMQLHQFQYISMYRLKVLRSMTIEYWRSAFFLAEVLVKARDMGCRLIEVEIRYAPRLQGKATGAKARLIISTLADMLHFWLRRHFSHRIVG